MLAGAPYAVHCRGFRGTHQPCPPERAGGQEHTSAETAFYQSDSIQAGAATNLGLTKVCVERSIPKGTKLK
jgi:hypothetical protein